MSLSGGEPRSVDGERRSMTVVWAKMFEPEESHTTEQLVLCADQAKFNLFWLAEPRVDTEGIDCVVENPVARSINTNMSRDVRAALQSLPLDFMRFWVEKNLSASTLAEGFYVEHMRIMNERAAKAHRRLIVDKQRDNVVWPKFGIRRSSA